MGCGASSQKNGSDDISPRGNDLRHATATDDRRTSSTVDPSSRTPGKSTTGDAIAPTSTGAGGNNNGPASGAVGGTGANGASTTGGVAANGTGGTTAAAAANDANGAAAVNLHTITDLRGCRVTTVIQNRNKVETMCRWLDNVIRFRDENHGQFPSPNRAGVASTNPAPREPEPARGDTASVSSRGTVLGGRAGNEMSTYSQGFLGVSTTMQSQGANMTTAAMQGSDGAGEESSMTPMRPQTGNGQVLPQGGVATAAAAAAGGGDGAPLTEIPSQP